MYLGLRCFRLSSGDRTASEQYANHCYWVQLLSVSAGGLLLSRHSHKDGQRGHPTHREGLHVDAKLGGQVAQRERAAGAHRRDVHVRHDLRLARLHLRARAAQYTPCSRASHPCAVRLGTAFSLLGGRRSGGHAARRVHRANLPAPRLTSMQSSDPRPIML